MFLAFSSYSDLDQRSHPAVQFLKLVDFCLAGQDHPFSFWRCFAYGVDRVGDFGVALDSGAGYFILVSKAVNCPLGFLARNCEEISWTNFAPDFCSFVRRKVPAILCVLPGSFNEAKGQKDKKNVQVVSEEFLSPHFED
jgi:hypothetical protein